MVFDEIKALLADKLNIAQEKSLWSPILFPIWAPIRWTLSRC